MNAIPGAGPFQFATQNERMSALGLITRAFLQAKKKKGARGSRMTIAVLNNRLLQMTGREFAPQRFGAPSLQSLLGALGPEVTVDAQGLVELVTTGSASTALAEDPAALSQDSSEVFASSTGRVREDLWRAVVDYASGQRYVWDSVGGRARWVTSEDEVRNLPLVPTLRPEELDGWRAEFLESNMTGLGAADEVLAMRWREEALATYHLPSALQTAWKRELTRRVRQRLQNFFATLGGSASARTTSDEAEKADQLESELSAARDSGDNFVVGELLLLSAFRGRVDDPDTLLAQVAGAWAAPSGRALDAHGLEDLLRELEQLPAQSAATAIVNALARIKAAGIEVPPTLGDIAFRLKSTVASIYGIDERKSPIDTCLAAVARLNESVSELEGAVSRFVRTTPSTAKAACVEVLRVVHGLYAMLVPAERGFLRDLDIVIGPAFRRLCEAYERGDDLQVLHRGPELLEDLNRHSPTNRDPRLRSKLWQAAVSPVLSHVAEVIEEAMSRGASALAPALRLRNSSTKADLRNPSRPILLTFALRNVGRGHAFDVSLENGPGGDSAAAISVIEPLGPFDIAPGGEQIVRVQLALSEACAEVSVALTWQSQTSAGQLMKFADQISVTQQVTEPNWDALISEPPYSVNPIKRADRLYGRGTVLARLKLAAMAGASTFVWGQKRIGKTSLLQVLSATLNERNDTTCVLLRMGEVAALHEGEIARLIASRLVERSGIVVQVPSEGEFGAGISRLVAFTENLCAAAPDHKFVVVIDEFDDIDPSFYTGERGKQFVKALRSISEVGLTFFFVGSERMDAIYRRHQADLNKWTNIFLDRIDSRADCAALITQPLAGAIEYSGEAIDFIAEYCSGNPFYMHNFCYRVFERCVQEHRTFVDDSDANAIRDQLLESLGPTNFAHFWEDNPLLDTAAKQRASAENCIVLACASVLGGRYETLDELLEAQDSLPLARDQRAGRDALRGACERLVSRRVLRSSDGRFVVDLQIFREWLSRNAIAKLVPQWTEYLTAQSSAMNEEVADGEQLASIPEMQFVIPEDDMLAVSQRLIYCNRQKDVADIRSWLRQFDDDARIEIAFLLLQRLAERGFVNAGARSLGLSKIEEMIKARRQDVGGKIWRVVRERYDNLCVTYVDSEIKSGSATAREIRNMMRPGKSSASAEVVQWMRSHADDDPLVAIVDDFAGSGSSLVKGILRFKEQAGAATWNQYTSEGRISVYLMYAFPEALERVRSECKGVHVVAANVLGDELRACAEDAGVFKDNSDRVFARDVLLQIGRELYPGSPMGYGDIGALFAFHNAVPNNTLPIFWSNGRVGERAWKPLFPRA